MKFLKRFGYKDGRIVIDVKPEENKIDEVEKEEEAAMKEDRNKKYLVVGGLMLAAFAVGYLRGVRDIIKDLNIIC